MSDLDRERTAVAAPPTGPGTETGVVTRGGRGRCRLVPPVTGRRLAGRRRDTSFPPARATPPRDNLRPARPGSSSAAPAPGTQAGQGGAPEGLGPPGEPGEDGAAPRPAGRPQRSRFP